MKKQLLLILFPLISSLHAGNWHTVEEKAKYAVVNIHAYGKTTSPFEPFNTTQQSSKWRGSGFFVDSNGYFLTNYHVAGKTKRLEISLPSLSRERFAAELVGCKPARDVALCRLTPAGKEKFETLLHDAAPATKGHIQWLPIAKENRLNPAQEVMALGYPLDDEFKRTIGHISGISVTGRDNTLFCQISAAINSGNSGGPTVNDRGEVIGINTASAVGMGVEATHYMSPVHTFRHLIKELKEHRVLHCDLGITFQSTTHNLIRALKCPKSGVYLTHTPAGSFGYEAGFRRGDIVMSMNKIALDNDGLITTDWIDAKVPANDILDHLSIGDRLEAEVWRNGKVIKVAAQFPVYTAPLTSVTYPEQETPSYRAFGGLVVQELRGDHIFFAFNEARKSVRPKLLTFLKDPGKNMERHLIITRIFDGSQAEREHALDPGTIIHSVNGTPVHTLDQLDEHIAASQGEYLTLESASGYVAALHLPTLLEEDEQLREEHRYKEAPGVTHLRGAAHYL